MNTEKRAAETDGDSDGDNSPELRAGNEDGTTQYSDISDADETQQNSDEVLNFLKTQHYTRSSVDLETKEIALKFFTNEASGANNDETEELREKLMSKISGWLVPQWEKDSKHDGDKRVMRFNNIKNISSLLICDKNVDDKSRPNKLV